jgi:ABC-type nitrate/sulfonate/bicarbonate transport system substrate-binding protein
MTAPFTTAPATTARANTARMRRTGLAAAAAIGLVTLLSACSGASTAAEDAGESDHGDIKLQLSWIKNEEFAGEYFAAKNGYYADAGFPSARTVDQCRRAALRKRRHRP